MFNFLKKYDILESDVSFYEELELLNEKVKKLESENIELTNTIYELENKIDMLVDMITPHDLSKFTLGDS